MILTASISQPMLSLAALRSTLAAAVAAGLDAVFFRNQAQTAFDPLVAIAALAELKLSIGLGGGVDIDYSEPFHVARSFAAIDRLTAGWSALVIEAGAHLGPTCGHTALPVERLTRRLEFFACVGALWDSWEDEALLVDRPAGLFTDPARIHRINHDGLHYAVRGPLNAPRPLQGAPVIVAPASIDRDLAAAVADVVMIDGAASCADFWSRAAAHGRSREAVKCLVDVAARPDAMACVRELQTAGACDGFNFVLGPGDVALEFLAALPERAPRRATLREQLGLRRWPSRYAA